MPSPVKLRVFTAVRLRLVHWSKLVEGPVDAVRLLETYATFWVGFMINIEIGTELTLSDATTGPEKAADSGIAFTRTLVIRKTRPPAPGASTGTPKKVMLLPFTIPWNTFRPFSVADVPCGVSVATMTLVPAA